LEEEGYGQYLALFRQGEKTSSAGASHK